MAEGVSSTPQASSKSHYGPSFDEIERRDPVQWQIAYKAWVLEKVVEQEMLGITRN